MFKIKLLLCIMFGIPLLSYANKTDPVVLSEEGYYAVRRTAGEHENGIIYDDTFDYSIVSIYTHICEPHNNIFTMNADNILEAIISRNMDKRKGLPLSPMPEKPENKMKWNGNKTSERAFVMVNGKETYPKMPAFECVLGGNIIKIQYAYGVILDNYDVVIFGDTYPSEKPKITSNRIFHVDKTDSKKFIAFFVNGQQITPYSFVRYGEPAYIVWGKFPYRHKFTYVYDPEKKQYYIKIWTGDYYEGNGSRDLRPLPYAYKNGNFVEETAGSAQITQRFTIKLYHNITQPDGTVSP